MKRWLLVLWLVGGCPASDDRPTDDSDTNVDSDSDRPSEDTFEYVDPDTDPETDPDSDTDTDAGPIDTGPCRFGYIEDCNGACYPEWFVGDGTCDDGTGVSRADFDCAAHRSDGGDCVLDTDTDTTGCGRFTLEFNVTSWPNEIGWRIERVTGPLTTQVVYKADAGVFTTPNTTYTTELYLPVGNYQFVGTDMVPGTIPPTGDGWHGGWFQLVDKVTGHAITSSTPEEMNTRRSSIVKSFSVNCQYDSCELDLVTLGGRDGSDVGWELFTSANRAVAERRVGTVARNATARDKVTVYSGGYVLRQRDARNDGWADGRVETRHAGGLLVRAQGLTSGSSGSAPIQVQCQLANEPAIDAPGAALTPTSCQGMRITLPDRGTAPADVGWALHRVDGWVPVAAMQAGAYGPGSVPVTVSLSTGLYYLHMSDAKSDGWQGARLRLEDPTGGSLAQFLLPKGGSAGRYVQITCPLPPSDTDDTDVDTDPPVPTCRPGAVFDCDDVCFPAAFLGDGHCDDGADWSPNFACAEHAFDQGDCPVP